MTTARLFAILAFISGISTSEALAQRIYWGDSVPARWNGQWPNDVRTIAEQSGFTRTVSTLQLHEYINTLKWKSENLHVLNMFTSPMRKVAPAIVLSNPRVTTPQQARAFGKPVVFLMGNIHPPEPEATEALLLIARDILLGTRKNLLDNQIIIIAPIFNVDGTDTFVSQDGSLGSVTPHILGVRENAAGLDLNRDAVKLETVEANGLYRLLNAWDPVLFLDGHLMSRVTHGYANTYGAPTVPASHAGPRDYLTEKLFPAVRETTRRQFGLEVFTHALFTAGWPPAAWSHDRASWTVEAKFVVNDYGLRNRMAIITETPGQPTFEKRVYAQYAYILALLEYTNSHAKEMQAVVKAADDETVANVRAKAESGELRNFLDGEYQSRGKIEVLGYQSNVAEFLPGTSVRGTRAGDASGPPEVLRGVDDLTKPVGTRSAVVPRGYIIPAQYPGIVAKLQAHNINVTTLAQPMRAQVEQFNIERMRKMNRGGYDMTVLDGTFGALETREFPAGTHYLDMAQPMANAAFYYLEPQARDGFVGWGVLDSVLQGQRVYPILKMRREIR